MRHSNWLNLVIIVALVLSLLLALGACSSERARTPSVEVRSENRELVVHARGELVASESVPIALPPTVRMGFNIAWMAPEFSEVSKGEVIARFDDVQVRLDRDATALEVAKLDFDLANTERTGTVERRRIDHEAERVEGEKDISETFANADQELFSRNEIIDALADLDYLQVESGFLAWQASTYEQRSRAEQDLILAEKSGHQSKLDKQTTALDMMELRSPADGTFVYARTPWGEKLGKGKTVFPGMPVGMLPLAGKVKARLFVPEADAVGLEPGQSVRLRLDSAARREFSAKVTTVSPVASPRERDNPQKFFTVEASIDTVDPDLMRVGSRLRAQIITADIQDGIVVPAQSLHGDGNEPFVFVLEGDDTRRQPVKLGRRSPDLVEVVDGIGPGDRVSLIAPAGSS